VSALWGGIAVGDEVVSETFALTRDHLVRYAGASGDFNPIHYRDDVAQQAGLDGVLAHGMLTMGLAIAPVVAWLGERGSIRSYQVRFTKPVYVPAEGATSLTSSSSVTKIPEDESSDLTLSLTVTAESGQTVLGKAIVVVTPR
jgi:acyl dehydratase